MKKGRKGRIETNLIFGMLIFLLCLGVLFLIFNSSKKAVSVWDDMMDSWKFKIKEDVQLTEEDISDGKNVYMQVVNQLEEEDCKDANDGGICFLQVKKLSEGMFLRFKNKEAQSGSTIFLFEGDLDSTTLEDSKLLIPAQNYEKKFCVIEDFQPNSFGQFCAQKGIFDSTCELNYYYHSDILTDFERNTHDAKLLGENELLNIYWDEDTLMMNDDDNVNNEDVLTAKDLDAKGVDLPESTFPLYYDQYLNALCFIENSRDNKENLKVLVNKQK